MRGKACTDSLRRLRKDPVEMCYLGISETLIKTIAERKRIYKKNMETKKHGSYMLY